MQVRPADHSILLSQPACEPVWQPARKLPDGPSALLLLMQPHLRSGGVIAFVHSSLVLCRESQQDSRHTLALMLQAA